MFASDKFATTRWAYPEMARHVPADADIQAITVLEQRLGPLPAALRACLMQVGEVWLCGTVPGWDPPWFAFGDVDTYPAMADPLVLPSAAWLAEELAEWDSSERVEVSIEYRQGVTLVEYLRASLAHGGFAGAQFMTAPPSLLATISEDLIPFWALPARRRQRHGSTSLTVWDSWHDVPVSADGKREVIAALQQLLSQWDAGPPPDWENLTIPAYLEAMAAWLEVYEQAFGNAGRPASEDGWTIFAHAVRAAAAYG